MRSFLTHIGQMDYEQVTAWLGLLVLIVTIAWMLRLFIRAMCELYAAGQEAQRRFELEIGEKNRARLRKHVEGNEHA